MLLAGNDLNLEMNFDRFLGDVSPAAFWTGWLAGC